MKICQMSLFIRLAKLKIKNHTSHNEKRLIVRKQCINTY